MYFLRLGRLGFSSNNLQMNLSLKASPSELASRVRGDVANRISRLRSPGLGLCGCLPRGCLLVVDARGLAFRGLRLQVVEHMEGFREGGGFAVVLAYEDDKMCFSEGFKGSS